MAVRHRRPSDDPFFVAGDAIALQSDSVLFYYHDTLTTQANNNEEDETEERSLFACFMPQCHERFVSLHECDVHYEERHTHQCAECGVVWPNDTLLDWHIRECHDSYFAACVDRGKASFPCLAPFLLPETCTNNDNNNCNNNKEEDGCSQSFPTDQLRLQHMQNFHGIPKWFRFHLRVSQTRPNDMKPTSKKELQWRSKHGRKERAMTEITNSSSNIGARDDCMHEDSMETTNETVPAKQTSEEAKLGKRQKRRELQRQKRATIPCKFFNKGECWKGTCYAFMHDVSTSSLLPPTKSSKKGSQKNSGDKFDMDDLTILITPEMNPYFRPVYFIL